MDSDPLQRFLDAQDCDGTYQRALAELRAGRKTSHWMWFVFPQRAGLGHSEMSRRYAIASAAEARAYVEHPILGPRLVECSEALLAHEHRSAEEILGAVDAAKLRSSMTLFAAVAPEQPAFARVLERYCDGEADGSTSRWL
ncbi:MAG TPA: DUF1810 domain-containing protein [Solirubrobacterales bacterium]|nr:DUF1810 domain-containing protein [Solirubrobacterales bacterium]